MKRFPGSGRVLSLAAAAACAASSIRFFTESLGAFGASLANQMTLTILRWVLCAILIAVHILLAIVRQQPDAERWGARETAVLLFFLFAGISCALPLGIPPAPRCAWAAALYAGVLGLHGAYRRELLAQAARENAYETQNSEKRQAAELSRLEENHRRTRELWHDLNHHIGALHLLHTQGREEELTAYLAQMRGEIETVMLPARTGNVIVDAVLADKITAARRDGIEIRLNLCPLDTLSRMRPADLSAIFANAMDNAIEACRRLNAGRWIELRAMRQEDALTILFLNPASAPKTGSNGYLSAKGDGQAHGHGLRSIERSAARYGGDAVTGYLDGRFTLAVHLPLHPKE